VAVIPRRQPLSLTTPAERTQYATLHGDFVNTTNAIAEHEAWHASHGSGNDAHFLFWHRYFIRRLEDFLGAQAAERWEPIPYWPSNTPIPAELTAGTANANPNVAPPTWTTMAGGATADPVFGYTALGQFKSSAELGQSLGFSYHGQVHGAVGGTMATFQSPAAPIFFPWHGFIDHIWARWQRRAMPAATLITRGNIGDPSAANLRINLFMRRSDGNLWERYWNGSSWIWVNTGKAVFGRAVAHVRGDVEDVDPADIRINLFVQGEDRKLWERYWNGSSWSWNDTGKQVDGEPLILARGNIGAANAATLRINLFVRGLDGKLWERYWNGSSWTWVDTGKAVAGDPIAIVRGDVQDVDPADIRINLFVRGADNKLWERYWNGASWSWVDTGKLIADEPVAFIRGNVGDPNSANVRINVFVRGLDGKLWERYWNGSSWMWVDTGKGVRGRVVPIVRGNRHSVDGGDVRINLFVQGADGKLWERYWNGDSWSWIDTGKPADGEPFAVVRGNIDSADAATLRINLFCPVLQSTPSGGPTSHPHYDIRLWERYWNGASWSWSDTGVNIRGPVVGVVRGDSEGMAADDLRINLFAARDDGRLWERYWNGAAWSWTDTGLTVAI
jgi:Common central domain of tyrosinase